MLYIYKYNIYDNKNKEWGTMQEKYFVRFLHFYLKYFNIFPKYTGIN